MIDIQLIAQACVTRVKLGQSLKTVFPQELGKIESKADQAAVKNTVYGALRYLGYLEFALDQLVIKRPNGLVNLLLVGMYLIEFTRSADHAVVNASVSAAKQLGFKKLSGLVNGVLRNYLRQREDIRAVAAKDDEASLQHQAWWIDKLRYDHPDYAAEIFAASLKHPNLALRVNTRRISLEQYLKTLEQQQMGWWRPDNIVADAALILDEPVSVHKIPGFFDGLVSVQDVGAQTTASRLDLQPGLKVLDACSAPGGKACHILELEDVHLTALDKDPTRLLRVEENLSRLDLSATTQVADASNIHLSLIHTPSPRDRG